MLIFLYKYIWIFICIETIEINANVTLCNKNATNRRTRSFGDLTRYVFGKRGQSDALRKNNWVCRNFLMFLFSQCAFLRYILLYPAARFYCFCFCFVDPKRFYCDHKKTSPQCGNMPWPIYEGTFPQRLIVNLIFPYITTVYT